MNRVETVLNLVRALRRLSFIEESLISYAGNPPEELLTIQREEAATVAETVAALAYTDRRPEDIVLRVRLEEFAKALEGTDSRGSDFPIEHQYARRIREMLDDDGNPP